MIRTRISYCTIAIAQYVIQITLFLGQVEEFKALAEKYGVTLIAQSGTDIMKLEGLVCKVAHLKLSIDNELGELTSCKC